MSHDKESGTAIARDGTAIHYTIHGARQSDLPRMALVHSLGMNGTVWDGVVERLADRATIMTYDCRGHGASAKPPGPYTMELFARDLEDVLTHAGWSNAHIAGASLGGNVSLQFAVLNPSRVESLGLVDTTAWYGAEAPKNWEWRAREAEQKGLGALVEFQLARWFSDSAREQKHEGVERCRSIFLANDVAAFASSCRMLGAFDLRARIPELHVPTAIIVGEEDQATPLEMARSLEAGISGATLEIIPKARHFTFVERPDRISDFLSRLFDRVAPRTGSHAKTAP